MSASKELFQQGLKNRREVVGDVYVDRALNNGSSEFAFAGQQLTTEYASYQSTRLVLDIVADSPYTDGVGETSGRGQGSLGSSGVF